MNSFRHCHFYLFALPQQSATHHARVVVLSDAQHGEQTVQADVFELDDGQDPWRMREHAMPLRYTPAWASRCALRMALEDGGDGPSEADIARALLVLLRGRDAAPRALSAVLDRLGRRTLLTLLSTPLGCLFDAPAVQDWLGTAAEQRLRWSETHTRQLSQRLLDAVRALPFDPGLKAFAGHALQLGATLSRIDTPEARTLRSLLTVTCWPAIASRAHQHLDDWPGPADVHALWIADRLDSFTSALDGLLPGWLHGSAQAHRAWLATLPAMLQALPQPQIGPWLRRLAVELTLQDGESEAFAQAYACMVECWTALGTLPAARADAADVLIPGPADIVHTPAQDRLARAG